MRPEPPAASGTGAPRGGAPPASRPVRIAVIGGGVAGLAAAHRLVERASETRADLDVVVCEAGPHVGGAIRTERQDGYLIEDGPDSFLTEKPWAVALCGRLGIADRLIGTAPDRRQTFVVRGGRLRALPDGFTLMAPMRVGPVLRSDLFTWRGKLRMGMDLLLPRGPACEDESLAAFVTRRFGREVLDRVAQPMVAGIYTADPETLSLGATMPRFLDMERRHRSVILALLRARAARANEAAAPTSSGPRWSLFVALDAGMGSLIDALCARLPAGSVRLGTRARAIARGAGSGGAAGYRVELQGAPPIAADGVVVATRAPQAGALVDGLDAGLADQLRSISYASSAVVTLAYRREQIAHALDGFGFVVPAVERLPILACSFSSVKFAGRAPAGCVLLRVFLGGALRPEELARDDAALTAVAADALRPLLGINGPARLARVRRHLEAMPQYVVGHVARVARIESRVGAHTGLALAGGAYRGVGIPDCVRSGEQAAERVFNECVCVP
ncbi:MAG TPA: protoporphyrinogen oxidase [bacterium]|nr:protoporphyrinogen oxidase [bacterium]